MAKPKFAPSEADVQKLPHLVRPWVRQLAHHNWRKRVEAVRELALLKHEKTLPFLHHALEDETSVKDAAVRALREIAHVDSILPLAKVAAGDKPFIYDTDSALSQIHEKAFAENPEPTFRDKHYPFLLINHKESPKSFFLFCRDFHDTAYRKFTDEKWRLHAKQLVANEDKLK